MSTKKIKKHNPDKFLEDLKLAAECMVYCESTKWHFKILKREVKKRAEAGKIYYEMTDHIYKVKHQVMIVY